MTAIPPTLPPVSGAPIAAAASRATTLSPQQVGELHAARKLGGKVRRAAFVASTDGWSLAVFAFLTLLTSLFDVTGLLLGAGMAVVAAVELRGVGRLRALDAAATRTLALNQVALALMLILYALWNIYTTLTGPGPFASAMAQGGAVAEMLKPYEEMARQISLAVYGTLILIAVFVQGGMAVYYFTRRRHIEAYVNGTPEWVLSLQRAGVKI